MTKEMMTTVSVVDTAISPCHSAFDISHSFVISHSSFVIASVLKDPLHFAYPRLLWLAGLLPVLGVLAFFARRRQLRALAQLGSRPALLALATISWKRRALASFCFSMSLSFLIFAVAGPRWGYEPQPASATGRDVVVVLDLSRSMLAEDVLPNRLGRARQALDELADVAEKSGGHRLGLVVFAGQARVLCPLTPDYDHFREALADLDPADPAIAPKPAEEGVVSGTRIGLGLRQALTLLDPRFGGQQEILLISDGDDPVHDQDWEQGADAARERGIEVHTVGIGNPAEASIIPDAAGRALTTHEGREIRTRLEERPLEEIARVTGGRYLAARLDVPPLPEWFRTYVHNRPGHGDDEDLLPAPVGRASWFYGAALGFLALATIIGDRPRPRKRKEKDKRTAGEKEPQRQDTKVLSPAVVALVVVALVFAGAAPRQTAEECLRAGNAAFHAGQFDLALDFYTRAEEMIDDPGLVALNKAATFFRLGQYHQAAVYYQRSLEDATGERRADLLYDRGNALLKEAQAQDDARVFNQAIRSYEECLREPAARSELQEDAKHNLKLAQALRRLAKPREDSRDPDRSTEDRTSEERNPATQSTAGTDSALKEDSKGKPQRVGQKEIGKDVKRSNRPMPGTGNLQPVPDEDELVPMPPEDAAEHLRRAAESVLTERKQSRRAAVANSRRVMNW
jgi:Ca-activated chloride channel family protein